MSNGFKAIATTYNGISFKSRFESEVAMLLDKLGLSWEYEPKSFLLPGGHYMPDFFVSSMNMWVEARGYNGKDWQIEQFTEFVKPLSQSYLVFKSPCSDVRITKTSSGLVMNQSKALGHFIDIKALNGHIMIYDSGRIQSVMEWPGFSDTISLDLATMLLEERKEAELQPIDINFYRIAMEYLNNLSNELKEPLTDINRQITQDAIKAERNALNRIIDLRLKKLARRAIISARTLVDEVDISNMASEEAKYFLALFELQKNTRASIFANAFKSDENQAGI